jgi:hypothetical protein
MYIEYTIKKGLMDMAEPEVMRGGIPKLDVDAIVNAAEENFRLYQDEIESC